MDSGKGMWRMNGGDEAGVRVMLGHPFFDVEEVLEFPLVHARKLAAHLPEQPFRELEQYAEVERRRADGNPLAERLKPLKCDSEFEASFEQWEVITGFILSTDSPAAIERYVREYVEHTGRLAVLAVADRDMNSVDSFCLTCLLQFLAVAIKTERMCDKKVVGEALKRFDELVAEIINADPSRVRSADRAGPFVRVVTGLLAVLLVTSEYAGGLNMATFNNALQLKQRLGSTVWGAVRPSDRYRFSLCSLHFALAIYGDKRPLESFHGFSDNCLMRLRHILLDGMESVPHPTTAIYSAVFRYFIDQIDRGVNCRSADFHLIQENFTDVDRTEIMRLADKFRVYHYGITFERLVRFLGQFQTLQMMRAALVLLRNLKFYTMVTLQTMLESVFRDLPNAGEPHTVVPLGSPGGSTSLMHYLVSHWSLGKLHIENDLERVLGTTADDKPLYFIDDCTLSGTQTINTFAEYVGRRELKPHHTVHCQPLRNADALLRRPIVLTYAIGSFFACKRLRLGLAELGLQNVTIKAAACEDTGLRPFTPSMEYIWEEQSQREMLAGFLSEVGFSILEPRAVRKAWMGDRRRESALGFSDYQRLIVFQYNVPKTTITPLWETGPFQGKDWMPLFPVSD
ncbi:MAG: hypothetical protein NTY19_04285 [Planctomycetota bacterium]|nr:hypothetical protein [Planctomycetota bacterium]